MGMLSFSGVMPLLKDAKIAKNYLDAEELKTMNNLVSAYFDIAELAAIRRRPMRMNDFLKQLDALLSTTGEKLLQGKGRISHEQAMQKAEKEYRIYQQNVLSPVEQDYLLNLAELRKQVESKGKQ